MERNLFIYATAGVFTIATAMAAQGPPPNPQTPQTPPRPAPTMQQPASQPSSTVTVEGCLMREKDIGREPNVAERAGIAEDFILTNAKMVKGNAPPDAARTGQTPPKPGTDAARAGQPGTGQAANLQPMYDVKELDADRLKTFVGKRVQIEGTFADTERSASAGAREDLVDIRGTTIKEVPGQCTPKP